MALVPTAGSGQHSRSMGPSNAFNPHANEPITPYSKVVEEQVHKEYGGGKHGSHLILMAVSCFLGIIMNCCYIALPVYTKNTQIVQASITMWKGEVCFVGTPCVSYSLPQDGICVDWRSKERAIQAFAIISLITSVNAAIWSILDVLQRCPHYLLPIVSYLLFTIFNFLCWTVTAGSYHTPKCDSIRLSADGYKLSVSFALMLCLWFMQMSILVLYLVKRFLDSYKRKAVSALS
jgi:hypothetical protein